MKIKVTADRFRLKQAFTISRGSRVAADVLTVKLSQNGHSGWAECVPYARYGETLESVEAQINALPDALNWPDLPNLLPAGAARNAVDCAFWDLNAKLSGMPVWRLAGLPRPSPKPTAFTLSLDTPEAMHAAARAEAHRPILKIKLGTEADLPRLEAVHTGAPNARLIVDANEGWSVSALTELLPMLVRHNVVLIEQPLPAGEDEALEGLAAPIPICADESCHTRADLPHLKDRYQMVNIKLDKTGGLTEALTLQREARMQGFGVMVGCMVGSSLAMAPAVLLAGPADVADLDGPLLLAEDRSNALKYDAAGVHPPQPDLWG